MAHTVELDHVERVIDLIYECATEFDQWPELLRTLEGWFGGPVQIFGAVLPFAPVIKLNTLDPAYIAEYASYYYSVDAWMEGSLAVGNRPGVPVFGQDFIHDDALKKTEFYNDFLRKHNVFHMAGVALEWSAENFTLFNTLRSERAGPYGSNDLKLLKILAPHVLRGVRLGRRMARLQRDQATLEETIDHLEVAVIIVDAAGRVSHLNYNARILTKNRDGIAVDGNGAITAVHAADRVVLRDAIRQAATPTTGAHGTQRDLLSIRRARERRPLVACLVPLRGHRATTVPSASMVAVLINDPEDRPIPSAATLNRLFGLTPSEARIVGLLGADQSLAEIGDSLGVSHNTLKTHMRHIFQKTETSSQSQLVRLVVKALGMVRG